MPADEPYEGDDELEQLRAIAGRVGTDPVAWETPPADMWERIATEVGDQPARPSGGRDARVVPITATANTSTAPISSPARRRPPSWVVAAMAAAAAVVVVVAGALVWSAGSETPVVVAQTQLERLGDAGDGHAELVERRDGGFELRVSTASLVVEPGAFVEVWVINPDVTEMVSLGPLRSDGRHELPAGLDPAGFPIVDLSIEPFDGNPTHSGKSVLRGQLTL